MKKGEKKVLRLAASHLAARGLVCRNVAAKLADAKTALRYQDTAQTFQASADYLRALAAGNEELPKKGAK